MEAEKYFKVCFPRKYTMGALNSDLEVFINIHERKINLTI